MDYRQLLGRLVEHEVQFVIVGGAAAALHGSVRLTLDLDIVYSRSNENLSRLVEALKPLKPYLRGAPEELPFRLDEGTLKRGLNFTLTTTAGPIDLLGEMAGFGTYEKVIPHSIQVQVFGMQCQCIDLDALIIAKRAAGRPKDFEAVAELETIREQLRDSS